MKIVIVMLVAFLSVVSTVSAAAPVVSGPGGVPQYAQCFQWIWLSDFYAGRIDMIQAMSNQSVCRSDRLLAYGI